MNSVFSQHLPELEALCRLHGVHRLEVFGSTAKGGERAGESDIDLLVEFEAPPPGGYANSYFSLLEALEALYGKRVDLVVASAIRNPYFLQSIEQSRTLLYAA